MRMKKRSGNDKRPSVSIESPATAGKTARTDRLVQRKNVSGGK